MTWYNSDMNCIECNEPLREVPVYNGGEEAYPPSFLFCINSKCKRHGLLTVVFKSKEKNDTVQPKQ